MIYALDSNIVSYILKEDAKVVSRYRQALNDDCEIAIPPIVYYEIQRGLLAKGYDSLKKNCNSPLTPIAK